MRNIEIKARIDSPEQKISKIKQLTNDECKIIKQHDTFFKVPEGRLKLRKFQNGSGELLYYMRTDTTGPKLCSYEKAVLDAEGCAGIAKILAASNGCIGIVEKTRKLYMIGQTRVHIDNVKGLGDFLELEVVLADEQDTETGEKIAHDLMTKLDIKEQDLIANAYIDLLTSKSAV
ncbi:uncharacterized protein LOC143422846 [Xylocopa sonorina]|uniref:uncharacterized protein LOC143422846 n=1 Tax=Xylocopa sonorina TaxID=1818115 RepID=UPI00403AFEF8